MIIFPLPPCVLVKSALVAGDSIVSPFTDDAVGAVHGNFELAFAYGGVATARCRGLCPSEVAAGPHCQGY